MLDFDDLSCVEVNVKFSVENVAAMSLVNVAVMLKNVAKKWGHFETNYKVTPT